MRVYLHELVAIACCNTTDVMCSKLCIQRLFYDSGRLMRQPHEEQETMQSVSHASHGNLNYLIKSLKQSEKQQELIILS